MPPVLPGFDAVELHLTDVKLLGNQFHAGFSIGIEYFLLDPDNVSRTQLVPHLPFVVSVLTAFDHVGVFTLVLLYFDLGSPL